MLAFRPAPRDLTHGGLVQPEIEQLRKARKRGIEADQAIAFAAEQAEIDDVEGQCEHQPRTDAGKVGGNVDGLTIHHYHFMCG